MENVLTCRENGEIDRIIRHAAGRAFAIGLIPGTATPALHMANDAYMFYQIAEVFHCHADEKMLSAFIASLGTTLMRGLLGFTSPAIKAPAYSALTFAFGKAAKHYFLSGANEELKEAWDESGIEA